MIPEEVHEVLDEAIQKFEGKPCTQETAQQLASKVSEALVKCFPSLNSLNFFQCEMVQTWIQEYPDVPEPIKAMLEAAQTCYLFTQLWSEGKDKVVCPLTGGIATRDEDNPFNVQLVMPVRDITLRLKISE